MNAVNMTELANATKIAASQSASAGVSVDEMTAAVGTMIATTQQGGAQAGRAWRSILMALQQVTGEIDETTGEALNTDDLNKYEKAVNALGVSMKTVEDGAIKLRDPIEILKELSEAYNQLDIDDSRRTNLLSAIGGRYRANQLDALLKNFDTYEKMLQEFSEGTGSAAEEAEKTANSWEGSLNKFNNSVTELVNNFVNSGNAKNVINFFTTLVNTVDGVVSAFGSLGTAVGIFSAIMISKSKSLHFSYDQETQSLKLGTEAFKGFSAATLKQSAHNLRMAATAKLANVAINLMTSLIISGVVSAISSWINAEEELERRQKERIQKIQESISKYKENTQAIEDNIATYKKLMEQDSLSESDKQELLDIQNQIIDTYGVQAEGIDLVNGKLQEQLGILESIANQNYQDAWSGAIELIDDAKQATEDNNVDTYISGLWATEEEAKLLSDVLKDVKGINYSESIRTFSLDAVDSSEKVKILTEALKQLNEQTTAKQKESTAFRNLRGELQSDLDKYKEEVDTYKQAIEDSNDILVKGLTPEQIGTKINWQNVTDATFKEWYDAIISYYNSGNYSQEYIDAVVNWFNRNYTSIAQRLARGTSITDIAYESEKAFKAAMSSDNGVYGFSFDAYEEDIEAVTTEFKNLQSIIDKIDKGNYSAIEDGFGLAKTYPDLLLYINDTDLLRQKLVQLQKSTPDQLVADLTLVRENLERIGDHSQIAQIDTLIKSLQSLTNVTEEAAETLTAKDYLKIQQDGIEKIIDKLSDEKDALNEALDSLNERKSQIEDYYDTQINALKEENEEREKNIELQEKQKALDNAKKNKVRVYSAARGFTIQEDSESIAKAQQDLDAAIKETQIDDLEKQKSSAVKSIEEEIDARKKDIKSKEDDIDSWKDYKTKLTEASNAIIDQNDLYLEAQKQFVLDENSTFIDRENNLKAHLERLKAIVNGEDGTPTLTTETFDLASQTVINSILATSGLSIANPLPQANASNSKLADMISKSTQMIALSGLALADSNTVKSLGASIAKNIDQNNTFAPVFNISANKVDDASIKNWWQKQINEEYSKFLVGNKQ